MNEYCFRKAFFLVPWVLLLLTQVVFGITAIYRKRRAEPLNTLISLWVSVIASALPFITLVSFMWVFVIGRLSNVAQFAVGQGQNLWGFWAELWPILFVGNPIAFVVSVVAILMPPYSKTLWTSFVSRVLAIVNSGFAVYVVITFYPDA